MPPPAPGDRAGVWLIYMTYPVEAAWQHPEPWRRVVGVAAAVVYSVLYLVGFLLLRTSLRGRAGRHHLAAAIGKTGARTRAEAVRITDERGWL